MRNEKNHLGLPKYTSNGLEIYYDNITKQPVGIVWENLVVLNDCSMEKMNWYDAVNYCNNINVNGITAMLPPVWLCDVSSLCKALEEIGAENIDVAVWSAYANDFRNAYVVSLVDCTLKTSRTLYGKKYQPYLGSRNKISSKFFVRPVLKIGFGMFRLF